MEIGSAITEEQRELFTRLLTSVDVVEVSEKTNVGVSTLNGLRYRSKTITETNINGLKGLIGKCNEKIENSILFFQKCEKSLNIMDTDVTRILSDLNSVSS